MSAQPASQQGLTVITPEAVAAYAYVWKPRPKMNGQGEEFSIVLVFDKKADLSRLRKAAALAASKKWGDKIPKGLKNPFRNGDEKEDPLFHGKTFITARTQQKPGIVDKHVEPILDETEFYSGCKCRASVYAHAFDQQGSKGVTFLLNNLQKTGEGTRISGRRNAEDEFDAVAGSDDADDADADDEMFDTDTEEEDEEEPPRRPVKTAKKRRA